MKTKNSISKLPAGDFQTIENAVNQFLSGKRACWAIPHTDRHTSNFYGDTPLCRFTRVELVETIAMYHENYGVSCSGYDDDGNETTGQSLEASIEEIIEDMTLDKPMV
jgi:hypothetical protein